MKNLMWMVVAFSLLAGLLVGCNGADDAGTTDAPTATGVDEVE